MCHELSMPGPEPWLRLWQYGSPTVLVLHLIRWCGWTGWSPHSLSSLLPRSPFSQSCTSLPCVPWVPGQLLPSRLCRGCREPWEETLPLSRAAGQVTHSSSWPRMSAASTLGADFLRPSIALEASVTTPLASSWASLFWQACLTLLYILP